jgi:hypothetical protein
MLYSVIEHKLSQIVEKLNKSASYFCIRSFFIYRSSYLRTWLSSTWGVRICNSAGQ